MSDETSGNVKTTSTSPDNDISQDDLHKQNEQTGSAVENSVDNELSEAKSENDNVSSSELNDTPQN